MDTKDPCRQPYSPCDHQGPRVCLGLVTSRAPVTTEGHFLVQGSFLFGTLFMEACTPNPKYVAPFLEVISVCVMVGSGRAGPGR